MVELSVGVLGRGPGGPLVGLIENKLVALPDQLAFLGLFLLQVIEVFEGLFKDGKRGRRGISLPVREAVSAARAPDLQDLATTRPRDEA